MVIDQVEVAVRGGQYVWPHARGSMKERSIATPVNHHAVRRHANPCVRIVSDVQLDSALDRSDALPHFSPRTPRLSVCIEVIDESLHLGRTLPRPCGGHVTGEYQLGPRISQAVHSRAAVDLQESFA